MLYHGLVSSPRDPLQPPPSVLILGGTNGAGKSTAAEGLLPEIAGLETFVNADTLARGLNGFAPQDSALAAGRLMLTRLKELARQQAGFAFETTLASRSFAPFLQPLRADGYSVHLFFLWLSSPELALARVEERVRRGGHSAPESDIRRRYSAGLANFFSLYLPLADSWRFLQNEGDQPLLVAHGNGVTGHRTILRPELWAIASAGQP